MNLTSIPIKEKRKISPPKKVYNIEVEDNHNYFANGLLVGNSHISLAEPLPNPIFVGSRQIPGPAVALTGLKFAEFEDIVHGKKEIDGKTGGTAIKHLLDKVDVKKELEKTKEQLKKAKGAELNSLNRKAKYLAALDKLNLKPSDAYIIKHVPVIPPIYRPITPMEDGSIQPADINILYKMLIMNNNQLKTFPKELPESERVKLRGDVYDSIKAVMGMGSTPTYDNNKKLKGILQTIAGDSPKLGFFQSKIMRRQQDLSMRSTITPAPEMSIDQVGLPRDAAMELYKPFVVRELVKTGKDIIDAQKEVKEKTPLAFRALENAIKTRPVLLKRDPVIHKYNIQAFYPILTSGNSIKLHPLLCSGFNADHDGDSVIGKILVVTFNNLWYKKDEENKMPHKNCKIISFNNIDIEHFPRVAGTEVVKNNCLEYDVPENTWVPSFGNGLIRWMPVTKFSIHPNCEEWVTKTYLGREIISSADHSLAVLDPDTLEVTKYTPKNSLYKCIPTFKTIVTKHLINKIDGEDSNKTNNPDMKANNMQKEIFLDWNIGWFIGATIGDGWVIHAKGKAQGLAFAGDILLTEVSDFWANLGEQYCTAKRSVLANEHTFDGSICNSIRTTLNCSAFGRWMENLIGSGAQNKHLPPGFLAMPLDFRMGLFCGLIDTDGTSTWTSRPQYAMVFHTTSKVLADEMSVLALSLGLVPHITEYENREKPAYAVNFSIRTVQNSKWIKLIHPQKREAIEKLWSQLNIDYGREDFVPITEQARSELIEQLKLLGATKKKNKNKAAFSQYVVLQKKEPVLTRVSLDKLFNLLQGKNCSDYLIKWFTLVLNPNIGWDLITETIPTGEYKTMYDITVPDTWTFCMSNGAIVWDTMAAYLPVTEEARKEAIEKMLPSNNLFSTTNYGVLHAPDQEAVMGLYYLSKWGKPVNKTFKTANEILADNSLHINDVVKLNGKETTKGRQLLVEKLPEKFKTEDILHNPDFFIKKKWLYGFLENLAKHDQKNYTTTVNHLKDLGNKHAFLEGLTISMKDLHPLKEKRDAILKPYHDEAEKIKQNKALTKEEQEHKIIDLYTKATDHLDKELHKEYAKMGNNIYLSAVEVGGKGSRASFRQMEIAPMLMRDGTNKIVSTPVTNSYAEGLSVSQYWTALHGARKGTLQKVEGTQEPGRLTKEIVNLNINTVITEPDCKTKEGIILPIDEVDITERFTAKPIKLPHKLIEANVHITPDLVGELKKHGLTHVEVRSAHKCKTDNGLCQHCIGHSAEGRLHEIGTNIGVIASQALGEPSIQMALDSFHCLHKDSLVQCMINNQFKTLTLESIWNLISSNIKKDGEQEIKDTKDLDIKVWDGIWISVKQILRHIPDTKIVGVSDANNMLICQETHPIATWKNKIECIFCGYHRLKNRTNSNKVICPNCSKTQDKQIDKIDNEMKYKEVKDIVAKKYYIHHDIQIPEEIILPPEIDPYLVGFFLAEGCVIYNKKEPIRLTISQNDGEIKDYIKSLIPKEWNYKTNKKAIVTNNKNIAKQFANLFPRYARNKCLPPEFMSYPNEYLADVLAGIICGNGTIKHHKDGPSQINIDTTSFALAQQINFICYKLGIVCNIVTSLNRKLTRYQGFRLSLRMTDIAKKLLNRSLKVRKLPEHSSPKQIPQAVGFNLVTNIKEVLYNDYVYDLTTESGSLYISGIKQHNTGGTAASRGGASVDKITRLDHLLNVPKELPGSATLAEHAGKITHIEKDPTGTGHWIHVDGKKHFAAHDREISVKVGDTVEKGDRLTHGPINPHKLLPLKGMEAVRNYITDELYNTMYKDERVRRRNVEIVTRNLTNFAQIKDAGNSHYFVGDIVPVTEIEKHNKQIKHNDNKISYTPILKGAQFISDYKDDDLLSKMNFQRLQNHILHAGNTLGGWAIHGLAPVPALATSSISSVHKPNY